MALQKVGYNIPFGSGLDLKTDPNQVPAGKMLALQNTVFGKQQLQKRNGFQDLTTLPNANQTTLTTLNDNLIATGTNLLAYSNDTGQWLSQGTVQPVTLETQSLVRNALSLTKTDTAVASNGLSCTTYGDASTAFYQINDSSNGQQIIAQTALPSGSVLSRVYVLDRFFIILFTRNIAGVFHLQYIAISIANPIAGVAVNIASNMASTTTGFDGHVANNNLYMAYTATDGIRLVLLSSTLVLSSSKLFAGEIGDLVSITADISGPTAVIWASFCDNTAKTIRVLAVNQMLVTVLTPTTISSTLTIEHITAVAKNGTAHFYYEVSNSYGYTAGPVTNYIAQNTCTTSGVVGTQTVFLRGVGLASKAFYNSLSTAYILVVYGQTFQPSLFLVNETADIVCRLAYSEAIGYLPTQILPNSNIFPDDTAHIGYLLKTQLLAVNKSQGVANVAGIYAQTGANLATFDININQQYSSEIALSLHLTGGQLWQYDSVKPVEHSFHVWPEDVYVTTSTSGGNLADQQYFYVFTYEWTDASGILHRSAPSIPYGMLTTGGGTSTNTIDVPTLRITAKVAPNPVKIVGYRWSVAQQIYYQFTSITSPNLNNPAVDYITITDTLADASILGNTILYTTGGVIENIAAPANIASTLFHSRLWIVDAEERNTLWYSKQVLAGTPVEMSDLQTFYVAPTAGAQGSTGPIMALSAMDDKLIIFKRDAIYYVTGNGPDATGAQNDFSEPIFITSTVGCSNPKSIVMTPQGIFFQSDKGIWLLGRDLSSQYIGSPVETYNGIPVVSALSIPGANEVRITLDNGLILMYDYFYGQWCTFNGIPAISSTLHNSLHTYLHNTGLIRQETPGQYLDGANPVIQSFSTAWLRMSDLQGFQRAYHFFFLGKYLSPHKLKVELAYDYDPAIRQTTIISPTNFAPAYGLSSPYGGGPAYGGPSSVEQWRIFLNKQKCQSIQITVTELYDASLGIVAGAGFTMSGINLVAAGKAGYPKLAASESAD